MQINAPATPGAIAVRLADPALAMPAKVSITPQTVPSNPMNGPPATAVESTIIPFSKAIASAEDASSITTLTASKDATLILVVFDREMWSVLPWPRAGSACATTRASTRTGLFLR